jgi:phosphoserine phosphatase
MLVVFDFDGTLAASDPFARLGEQHGTPGAVDGVLERMWSGELDYEEGLRTITDHLEGMPGEDVEAAFDRLQIRDGASDLLAALHRNDHHVAVVSDAPEWAVGACLDPYEFDVDTVVANRLPAANGALTGRIEGPPVGEGKDAVLERLAVQQGRDLGDTIAVGDDRRDLPMLQTAGTGVGVDPDPVVEAECDLVVPTVDRLHLRLEEQHVV